MQFLNIPQAHEMKHWNLNTLYSHKPAEFFPWSLTQSSGLDRKLMFIAFSLTATDVIWSISPVQGLNQWNGSYLWGVNSNTLYDLLSQLYVAPN